MIATTAGAQRPFMSASLSGEVAVLGPSRPGSITSATTTQPRRQYFFDFVRTLRDPACIETSEVRCITERMLWAGTSVATIDDDGKIRVWAPDRAAPIRRAEIGREQLASATVWYSSAVSAFVLLFGGDRDYHALVRLVPLRAPAGGGSEVYHRRSIYGIDRSTSPNSQELSGQPNFVFLADPVLGMAFSGCSFAFLNLNGFAITSDEFWDHETACSAIDVKWGFQNIRSNQFVARVDHGNETQLVFGDYRTGKIACSMASEANDAAFGADGDVFAAFDNATIVRYGPDCREKRAYRLHNAAVQFIAPFGEGRMLSRSVDGALKVWSQASGQIVREASGVPRGATLLDWVNEAGVLLLGEDRRLYIWYGEPRLGAYVGPAGPVCGGLISPDRNTIYARKCDGSVEMWRRQGP